MNGGTPNTGPDVRLGALFSEGGVLQRDCPLTVWGWGPPSRQVRVALAGAAANGWISRDGDFRVVLPPLPAGGPHILRVTLPRDADEQALEVGNIWIGEVWLASGQSNMEWRIEQCAEAGTEAAAAANDPLLRIFTVERRAELAPQRDVGGTWRPATAESAPHFSAVAYHFAHTLRSELDVAVGVVVSAWGGTPIEAWIPRRAHAAEPRLSEKLRLYERGAYSDSRWMCGHPDGPAVFPADPGLSEQATAWADPATPHDDWPVMELPGAWQTRGHEYSGVFWFRRTLAIPDSWTGRDLLLEIGAADKHDITHVNGVEVGRTGRDLEIAHWDVPRRYRVPASLVTGPELVIAVRVYSFVRAGGLLGPAEQMRMTCPQDSCRSVPLDGEWRYRVEHNFGHVPPEAGPGHLSPRSPFILHDNMIAPLAPAAMRGILWYQGESNTAQASEYPSLLRSLIAAWRQDWQLGDIPVLIVQLPGYGQPAGFSAGSNWARMRQGQLDLVRAMPNLGLAVTLDCGEANNLHPLNKEPVGRRLALWALSQTYGRPLTKCGPLPLAAASDAAGRVRVAFDCSGSVLASGDGAPVGGVFLLDAAGKAHQADTRLDGEVLWATADACPSPAEVCYAWADFPLGANLANREGLPASPFRMATETPAPAPRTLHHP